jgi:hypothetical protein
VWIHNDTERYYSQTEYGNNPLVVGDGGDGENSLAIQVTTVNELQLTRGEQRHVTRCLDLSDLIGPLNKREAAIGQTFT